MMKLLSLATLLGVGVLAGSASAQEPCCTADHTHARAGQPGKVAWYAHPSDTGRYIGYYVGGGAACHIHGDDRYSNEGTWGWDYRGFCLPSRIVLDWYHGRRYQGGTGAYKVDGPKVIKHGEEK